MADEPNLDAKDQPAAAELVTELGETKKRRLPAKRKEKAASVAARAVKGTPSAASSKSRRYSEAERAEKLSQIERRLGGGSTLRSAVKEAGVSEQTYYQWKRAAPSADMNGTAAASSVDSLADLVELEAENLRLRQLLAEKLRAENAELRKKLGNG